MVSSSNHGLDYHVDIDGHYYSVPHRLLKEQVEARVTQRTIELFNKGEHIACHVRGASRGRHTTLTEHMPSSHPSGDRGDLPSRAERLDACPWHLDRAVLWLLAHGTSVRLNNDA
jgi:hypothetical protein